MSVPDFLWLIHYGLCAAYLYTIGFSIYDRNKNPHAYEVAKDYKNKSGNSLFHITEDQKGGLIFFAVAHIAIYGTAIQAVPVFLIILIASSAYFDLGTESAKIAKKSINEMKAEEARQKTSESSFGRKHPDDDFDYEESAFTGRGSAAKPDKDAPRGQENWHPDDKDLWAKAYDPASTDAEREGAFKAILKRENKRKS